MAALTAHQKTLLRSTGHRAKTYLSIHIPTSILVARLNNASIDPGDRSIAYDGGSGTAGQFALVAAGQPLWVGTSTGAKDKGIVRVRSIAGDETSGTITVAENAIDWADNDYLTIQHDWPLTSIWPYIADDGTFYKDGPDGDTYTDENEEPPPVAIIGPHRVGFMESGPTLDFAFDGSNSHATAKGATISSYAWSFSGTGSFDNDTSATPTLTIAATNPNGDWVSCIVTDSNGKTQVARRLVFTHDKSSNMPYTAFNVDSLRGDWDQGGWSLSLSALGTADASTIPDNALIILWHEAWYGPTFDIATADAGANTFTVSGDQTAFFIDTASFKVVGSTGNDGSYTCSGNATHSAGVTTITVASVADGTDDGRIVHEEYIGGPTGGANQLFAGYIRSDTTEQDSETGQVSFEATTIQAMMAKYFMFSISLTHSRNPSTWYEYQHNNLTVANALHHLLKWHSTLLDIVDVFLPTSNTLLMAGSEDFTRMALFQQANTFGSEHSIFAHLCCNKQGQLHVEEDIQMLDDAARATKTTIGELTTADWTETIQFGRQIEKRTSMVTLSGFEFDGASSTPYIAVAPGEVPHNEGMGVRDAPRQVLSSQSQANALAGRVLAKENNTFPSVPIGFHGHYLGVLDVAPQEWWTMTLTGSDNNRGITWTDQKLICRSVSARIDHSTGEIIASASFAKEAEGPDGVTSAFPTGPPTDPPYDPDPPVWPPSSIRTGALFVFGLDGCWYRPPQGTDWIERNAGVTVDDDEQGGYDPWWATPTKQASTDPSKAILIRCQVGAIYRSINGGQAWVEVTPVDDPPNTWGDTTAPTATTVTYGQRVDSIHTNKLHIILVSWQEVDSGNDKWRGWFLKTEDDCQTWEWIAITTNVYTLLRTSSSSPYNVIEIGDSHTFGARATASGFKVDSTPRHIYFTVANPCTVETITCEYSNGPSGWTLGEVTGWFNMIGNGAGGYRSHGPDPDTRGSASIRCLGSGGNEPTLRAITITANTVQIEFKPIWADIDSEDGTVLWVTVWRSARLVLQKRAISDMSVTTEYDLGACTAAQLASSELIAFPHTPLADKDYCIVFGRMDDPQSLGGIQHIILTDDGGGSFSSVENGWGNDLCGALIASAEVGGDRTYSAIRNPAAGAGYAARFYRGIGAPPTLVWVSSLPFAAEVKVGQDAMSMSSDNEIAVVGLASGALMVAQAASPYNLWVDITGSHPGTGAIRSVVYV